MRRKLQTITLWVGAALTICGSALPIFAKDVSADDAGNGSHVVINEVKLGGAPVSAADPGEFVTLFNASGQTVDLNGWKLEYLKTPVSTGTCNNPQWYSYTPGKPPATVVELAGTLQPHQVSNAISQQLNNSGFGALHLVDSSGHVQDLVGWGTGTPCSEGDAAQLPTPPKSLQRYLACADSFPTDTDDNAKDFFVSDTPNPGGLSSVYVHSCQGNSGNTGGGEETSCAGVVINELLPNPAGTDTGHEFIELYNPMGATISLKGCALQTSSSTSKTFTFADSDVLQPGEYRALYDSMTGLTLPNSAGGTVWLLSPSQEELQQVDYPANLGDDVAWALFGNDWQQTYAPTPGAENDLVASLPCPAGQERNPETNQCRSIVSAKTLVPCKPNQARNPDTNRCRSILASSSGLTPCKAGQYRNPETNRCRSLVSSDNALKACKPGQVRNAATNRCKSTSSAGNGLKPCQPGWTRNPDTHRCRKSSDVQGAATKVHDVPAPITHSKVSWLIAALALLSVLAYATYEWRQEIHAYFAKHGFRFPRLRRKKS